MEISPVSINLEAASRMRRGFSDNPVYNTIPQVTVDTLLLSSTMSLSLSGL